MPPPRDDAPRTEPRARLRAWVLGTVIALIALAVGSVFGDRGILNMVGEREKVESLRVELEELRAENARLSSEIRDLRQSPRAIERLAREELGLARPDETVFLIREPSPDEPEL
jgi:cell division protein FtsB